MKTAQRPKKGLGMTTKSKSSKRAAFGRMVALALLPINAEAAGDRLIEFGGECIIEARELNAEGQEIRASSVAIVAYNGGQLMVAGYNAPVYVDLEGMSGTGRAIPLLREHDKTRIIGTVEAKRVGNTIEAAGKLVGKSSDRVEVEELAADGFEWQASVGVRPSKVEAVRRGQTAEVNGQTVAGPCYVARESRLAELTLCTVGADADTHVAVAAELGGDDLGEDVPDVKAGEGVAKIKHERARREKIEAAAVKMIEAGHDIGSIEAAMTDAIAGGISAMEFELQLLREHARPRGRISTGQGRELTGEQQERAVEASVLKQIQGWDTERLEASFDERTLNAMDRDPILRHGLSLQDLFLYAAEARGNTRISRRNIQAMLEGAFGPVNASASTFDLSGVLSNVANKQIKLWFMSVADLKSVSGGGGMQAYSVLGAVGSVSDFKQRTSYALTGDMTYEQVAPGGELKHGTLGEQAYTNQADTYGRIAGLDRRDIKNDDLGAFTQIGRRLGRGAALKLAEVFWTLYLNNTSFFTAGRNNFFDGSSTALAIDSLTTAEAAFMTQTDPDGKPLGVMAAQLLVPPALSATAAVLMSSAQIVSGDTGKTPANNPHAGKFAAYTSPYMSNTSYTGASALKWYLQADPMDLPTIETVFLDGKQQPTVEQTQADFNTLGVLFRGYHDFGVNLQEYRGGVAMKGEA